MKPLIREGWFGFRNKLLEGEIPLHHMYVKSTNFPFSAVNSVFICFALESKFL